MWKWRLSEDSRKLFDIYAELIKLSIEEQAWRLDQTEPLVVTPIGSKVKDVTDVMVGSEVDIFVLGIVGVEL